MKQTPSQTAGPFLHIGMMPEGGMMRPLAARLSRGRRITLRGTLTDAEGTPVSDALVEMWHPSAGWARAASDERGGWALEATHPAPAPFVTLWIIARGINTGLQTRLYFPDADWQSDAGMAQVPKARRGTLVASSAPDGAYRHDIRLGGERETVFFDI